MDTLKNTVTKMFKNALKAFSRFPASILSALGISLIALIKINMEWETQNTYSLLFDSMQLSFLVSAVFSMAAIAYAEIRQDKEKEYFIYANLAGLLVAISSFLLLYFFGRNLSLNLSTIATSRALATSIISGIAFGYLTSYAKKIDSFSDSFFMTNRASLISIIYGLVIMIGVSGVIGAFEALVYNDLSFKVYQYLSVMVSFLTYTLFLGYFPSFKDDVALEDIEKVITQPPFIHSLLAYILLPIMLALSAVLLIWTVTVLFQGVDVSFEQLASITTSYVLVGIWLHIMLAKHESKLAKFYKIAYPLAALFVLSFEAWALIIQISQFGIKTLEYSFTITWIFALVSVVLMLAFKKEAYRKIALAGMLIIFVSVLPILGYRDLTFNSQKARLEKTLIENQMLLNDNIIKARDNLAIETKALITDSVDFLLYSDKTQKPVWLSDDLQDHQKFIDTFGFERTYGLIPNEGEQVWYQIQLDTGIIDISDYPISVNIYGNEVKDNIVRFDGDKGSYEIEWNAYFQDENSSNLVVKCDSQVLMDYSLDAYFKTLTSKYLPGEASIIPAPLEDMSLLVENEELAILLVFSNIEISLENKGAQSHYFANLSGMYLRYK